MRPQEVSRTPHYKIAGYEAICTITAIAGSLPADRILAVIGDVQRAVNDAVITNAQRIELEDRLARLVASFREDVYLFENPPADPSAGLLTDPPVDPNP